MSSLQRWLLLGGTLLTGITGVVYWWMDAYLEPMNEWSVINHPLQPWVLKIHIIVAPLLIFSVGLIAVEHVWRHFRSRRLFGRRSGLMTMWVVVPMIMTGYLIQTATNQGWLAALAWVHIGTGVVYMGGVGIHFWVLRNRRGGRP